MAHDAAVLQHYLKPLQACLEPAGVTEVVVNRPGELGIEHEGGWEWRAAPDLSESCLSTLAEAARALTVPHPNAVHLLYAKHGQGLAKVGANQLLESALRMRPDRILLQELRDGTAFFYLRNVNTGHPGSITTIHADSATLAFEQLTLLVRESEGGRDLPRDDIRELLHLLVDVVVQMKKTDGRFRMTEVYYDPLRKRAPRN